MGSSFSSRVLTAALLFVSTTSLTLAAPYKDAPKAAPCPVPASLKDGMYLGIQAGFDTFGVRDTIFLPAAAATTGNPSINSTTWAGGLFLGYGRVLKKYLYAGMEIFTNFSGINANYLESSPNGAYKFNLISKSNFGVSFLPGIKLTESSLLYLRLGYSWANMRVQENVSIPSAPVYTSSSNSSNGFAYGLGFETLAAENWSLRADYTYSNYSSFYSNMGSSFNLGDSRFMLGAIYHFD
ncbi:unnamed protein product [Sphagnum balticum]